MMYVYTKHSRKINMTAIISTKHGRGVEENEGI
jgi:hypothetical protein